MRQGETRRKQRKRGRLRGVESQLWGEKCHIIFNIIITFVFLLCATCERIAVLRLYCKSKSAQKLRHGNVGTSVSCRMWQVYGQESSKVSAAINMHINQKQQLYLLSFHSINITIIVIIMLYYYFFIHTRTTTAIAGQCVNVYEIIFLWGQNSICYFLHPRSKPT